MKIVSEISGDSLRAVDIYIYLEIYHVGVDTVFNVYNQGVTLLAGRRQLSQVIYCSSQARQAQLFTQPPPYI